MGVGGCGWVHIVSCDGSPETVGGWVDVDGCIQSAATGHLKQWVDGCECGWVDFVS